MPILQTRVISIIQTAIGYRQAYQRLTKELKLQLSLAQIANKPDLIQVLETIQVFASDLPPELTYNQDINLLMEHQHFQKAAKANERKAKNIKMARQRLKPIQLKSKPKPLYDTQTITEIIGPPTEKDLF